MDCKTAQSLVIPYINDQLSDEETEDFLEHIENCKECYEELEIHFTVHYALQKLDEDDKISFNIPKMLKENLRDTKNRIHRRKIFHGVTACVVALAEILLLLTVMTQLEMFPEKSIGETGLYQFFHPGAGEETVQPVNLICIMNESLSDLRVVGDFSTNQEYFPFINSLTENTVKGSLCMPVFGSMTSNSEFEFLTGDSVAMLPSNSIAYQFNVKPDAWTMVSTVKDQGYRTVAMHPYPGENWNRNTCYTNMGFDEFLDGDYYEGSEQLRYYTSDQADFEKLIQVVEEKKDPQEKLFLFNVTMQNHGGYEGTFDEFDQTVWLTGDMEGKYPKADQYLSLVKRSDDAFAYLLDYFSHSDEPTMIVMFGDHQPSVEDEFFDEVYGTPSYEVPVKDRLMWYETPFIIWTNYEQPSEDMGKLGAVYLSSYVLKLAGLDMTPYNRFLLELSETYPVLHFLGFYDNEGNYQSWAETENEENPHRKQVLDYEAMAYNHSIDSRKYEPLFTLGEENNAAEE